MTEADLAHPVYVVTILEKCQQNVSHGRVKLTFDLRNIIKPNLGQKPSILELLVELIGSVFKKQINDEQTKYVKIRSTYKHWS